jgi:hypothetical protein
MGDGEVLKGMCRRLRDFPDNLSIRCKKYVVLIVDLKQAKRYHLHEGLF